MSSAYSIRPRFSILMLLVPFAAFFLSFTVPLLWGVWLSLFNSKGVFVGILNYKRAFRDAAFWSSITFTLIYSGGVTAAMTVLGFFIALCINQLGRGQGIVKTTVLIPWAISLTAWGLLMQVITSQSFGMLNDLLLRIGIVGERISWLGTEEYARPTVMVARTLKDVWFATLLFLVARQTLPEELYEEGKVSGANPWQAFRYITVPIMRNTMLFVVTILLIFSLQEFDLIFALTRGGPGFATETAALSIYRWGLIFGKYELGTAYTSMWSVLISVFVVLVLGRVLMRAIDKK